ncbi:tetratricopeptide repeat protein [Thermosporothrix hazakensis]|uniref:tetratricopeptide repeat protein n=1 Tax=Thermosporothrix hazakensis TaxID=644383 RepID=UPI0010E99EFC|nr:tetratricopeptide repeat protein [Thermosporothrix hazakensis]GCE50308.1 hypothetical protein KTH_51770 [Thermosporothrix hazakensis]
MDEHLSGMNQYISGSLNAITQGGGQASVNITNVIPPNMEPDAATLHAARQKLEELPLDTIPPPAPDLIPASSHMPLLRNQLFTGREDELRELARCLKGEHAVAISYRGVAATTGIGGIGKTQLASEFVYRYGAYFAGGVFWLDCSKAENMSTEVLQCKGALPPAAAALCASLPPSEQVEWVRRAWQTALPRLLIFDNCEDEAILEQWKPNSGGCRILITCRKQEWSAGLGIITVPIAELPRAESIELLRKYSTNLTEAAANQIAEELGDHPLALSLAGHYLHMYRHIITPEQYVQKLRQQTLAHASLQGRGAERSLTRHEQHVARTFAVSYERLQEEACDDLAKEMLLCAAWCAPGVPIPEQLLLDAAVLGEEDLDEERAMLGVDALQRLLDLGLLERARGQEAVRVHRLVAWFVLAQGRSSTEKVVASQTSEEEQAPSMLAREKIRALLFMVGVRTHEEAPLQLVALQAHLFKMLQDARDRGEQEQVLQWSQLLGLHQYYMGAYNEAKPLLQEVLRISEHFYTREHPYVASSLHNLAVVYKEQGKYEEALPLCKEALEIRKRVYGREHPHVASSLHNLANVYQEQGKYEEVLPLCKEALEIAERAYGREHPHVASSLHNLAVVYKEQGKYEEAVSLLQEVLEIYEKVYGREHPHVASSLHNLAVVYQEQGKYEEALPLCKEALEIYERVYGREHPHVASSLNNLAVVYKEQGKYEEALPLCKEALEIAERAYGREHPEVANSLHILARVYDVQGKDEEAVSLLQEALEIRKREYGREHPNVAMSLNDLARVHYKQGKYEEAVSLLQEALEIYERVYGREHPAVASALGNLATIYLMQGKYKQADRFFQEALEMATRLLGKQYPETQKLIWNYFVFLSALEGQGELE